IINEGSESLIAENQRKIKKTAKQRDVILDKDIMEKQELRHVLIEIESLDRDYHVQRKAMEIAHIKGHDKYDKDVVTFKEIVKTVLQKQDDQYQDYFKNLYDIASEESSSEGDVRKEFL